MFMQAIRQAIEMKIRIETYETSFETILFSSKDETN